MGSVQRSGAKSRNTDSTPSNRQSMGQQARKSFMAKGLRPDSAKIVGSRLKPLSSEGLNRLSLASLRFTPNRNSGPSSNILQAPASASSKMSTDTARSTGMGTVSRKETRPINDPAFKNQCIDKILDFLVQHGYEHQVNRRSLHTPSTKDFGNIFSFVYRHLDSSYVHPSRFEEEIPKLLKLLKYPVQMSKSSFITVGSPHTWPSVLAMLVWLVDLVTMNESLDPVACVFPNDERSEINGGMLKFWTHVNIFNCDDDPENIQACLKEHCQTLEKARGVRPEDSLHFQEEYEQLQEEIETLSSGPERLQQLQSQYSQIKSDNEKMIAYCHELRVHISNKESEKGKLESMLSERKADLSKRQEEVTRLENLQAQQDLSAEELARFKNHDRDVAAFTAQLQQESKDLSTQIWKLEMEISNGQRGVCDAVCKYNTLVRQLELPSDCEISSANIGDNLNNWQTTLLSELRILKKNARLETFDNECQLRNAEEDVDMVNEVLKEKNDEINKLENKMKRHDEDILMCKKENADEEQALNQENERLHQLILEARKARNASKNSLYQKECELEDLNNGFDATKARVEKLAHDGAKFLTKVCTSSLAYSQLMESEAELFKNSVNKMGEELLRSIASDDKVQED